MEVRRRERRGSEGEAGAGNQRRSDEAENDRRVALLSVASHPEED